MHGERISPLLVGGAACEFVAFVEEKFATSAARRPRSGPNAPGLASDRAGGIDVLPAGDATCLLDWWWAGPSSHGETPEKAGAPSSAAFVWIAQPNGANGLELVRDLVHL
jgi:hypothetical protein